jgi:hypothetical protein
MNPSNVQFSRCNNPECHKGCGLFISSVTSANPTLQLAAIKCLVCQCYGAQHIKQDEVSILHPPWSYRISFLTSPRYLNPQYLNPQYLNPQYLDNLHTGHFKRQLNRRCLAHVQIPWAHHSLQVLSLVGSQARLKVALALLNPDRSQHMLRSMLHYIKHMVGGLA